MCELTTVLKVMFEQNHKQLLITSTVTFRGHRGWLKSSVRGSRIKL